jgi:hypothetical protein
MSILRLIGIYLGLYRKQEFGIIDLDKTPSEGSALSHYIGTLEGKVSPENAGDRIGQVLSDGSASSAILDAAQHDAQNAVVAENGGRWTLARFWWARAASRFKSNSDSFVLYLMLSRQAANNGVKPPEWR